MVKTTEK